MTESEIVIVKEIKYDTKSDNWIITVNSLDKPEEFDFEVEDS